MNINLIVGLIAITWLFVLSGLSIWLYIVFKDLIKISKNKEFINNTNEIKSLWSELKIIKEDSKFNLHKVGLIKYNPFKETGGNNSFSLVLLDGNKNGIIITSLHTRERTMLYLKEVIKGKSKMEISLDEEKALKQALL